MVCVLVLMHALSLSTADYLEDVYLRLMAKLNIDPQANGCISEGIGSATVTQGKGVRGEWCAYNMVLTSQWVLAVPRVQQTFEGLVGINGLGEPLVTCGCLSSRGPSSTCCCCSLSLLALLLLLVFPCNL